jgi:hypothetical protein
MKARLRWLLGVATVWALAWAGLGANALWTLGRNPHPLLPTLQITGTLRWAVAQWLIGALGAYLILGLIFGLIGFVGARAGRGEEGIPEALTYRKGIWMGLGSALWVHGVLYAQVPVVIGTLPLFKWIPLGIGLLLVMGGGLLALIRAVAAPGLRFAAGRALGVALAMGALLYLPHDLFRKMSPAPEAQDPQARRLLLFSVDGLRQDVAEAAMPQWKAPRGVQPIVAVPATRLAWNMLMGGDPDTLTYATVIPYRDEWRTGASLPLLAEAQKRGVRTAFLIDDCTTLSFGLSAAPFDTVKEPFGGWKHFFSAGAGFTWPVYSWVENYLSPVETTNPWAEPRFFFRDVDRALKGHHWVSAHTCQLHAPFFLRFRELRALDQWAWLFHGPRAYAPYQSTEQVMEDHFAKAGRRSDPALHYDIRVTQLLREAEPYLAAWQAQYPALSGVVTSDHGELHVPILSRRTQATTRLTGIHGFTLDADTMKVPLHGFGVTSTAELQPGSVYSWFNLRDDLHAWLGGTGPLAFRGEADRGWVVRWPYLHPAHVYGPPPEAPEGQARAWTPGDMVHATILMKDGTWYLEDSRNKGTSRRLSYALVRGDRMITFNPTVPGSWLREDWTGYTSEEGRLVSEADLQRELKAFNGRLPAPLLPSP